MIKNRQQHLLGLRRCSSLRLHTLPVAVAVTATFTAGVVISSCSSTSLLGACARGGTVVAMSSTASSGSSAMYSQIYGQPPGPFEVGVTTRYFTDPNRPDPGEPSRRRQLQTEIWYPSAALASSDPSTGLRRRNRFSDFLGLPPSEERRSRVLKIANGPAAIGGYRDGLTVEELDDPDRTTWINSAFRDATPLSGAVAAGASPFPVVLFSHGSGAYRPSYIYWCEYLASHGFVVAAPDHPGSARFTMMKDGTVIVPGGPRSDRASMEKERPEDISTVLDSIEDLNKKGSGDPILEDLVDTSRVAVTGMSFGGFTTAAFLEKQDPRVKAAVMQCPSIFMSGTKRLHVERQNKATPVMVMVGTEDTVLGADGNAAARTYVETHDEGHSYLLEIKRGGHVSFTSCELYNPEYGNGIGKTQPCKSLTRPGENYIPLEIVQQHGMINKYGLAFLNTYLKDDKNDFDFMKTHCDESDEFIFQSNIKVNG
mmetsp:Transcript_4922/g.12495  ORF Transcript_4922/g.12495 Transcript_4922/m.12495 type:complete len:483 (+) Transcript_4922:46-1494(+)